MKAIRINVSGALFAAMTAMLFATTLTALAQEQRSLRVIDGAVYIDDRLLPADELPEGLNPENMRVNYTFSGQRVPIVRLGDRYYAIDGHSLRVATRVEREAFFPDPPPSSGFERPDVRVEFRDGPSSPGDSPHSAVFRRKAQELRRESERLQELHETLQERLSEQQTGELESVVRRMREHASEVAQVASELPRVELEAYLDEIRHQNQGLFDRLVSERELERRTLEMAEQIRRMGEGAERTRWVGELREQLDEIFELKQDNRRREIERLEERLAELEQRVAERERMREEIIDRRLRDLVRDAEVNR